MKDKTHAILLSGVGERGTRADDARSRRPKPPGPFQQLETGNPLEKLAESDRILLCSMLLLGATFEKADRQSDEDPFKRVATLAREAGRLGARLESEVFQGLYSDLMPFTFGFSDLPERLADFSKIVGEVMALFGGPGHEGKAFDAFPLILATEFVLLRTGRFYDEALSELYQYVSGRRKHFSGDTIRSRRDYLKEHSPLIYSWDVGTSQKSRRKLVSPRLAVDGSCEPTAGFLCASARSWHPTDPIGSLAGVSGASCNGARQEGTRAVYDSSVSPQEEYFLVLYLLYRETSAQPSTKGSL